MKRKASSAGFSSFELIVSIAIVCFLGEVTLPHYINQTTHARFVAMSAVAGALNTSVYLVTKEYRAQHSLTSKTIMVKGKSVDVTAGTGYPLGSQSGIGAIMNIIDGFTPTYNTVTEYDLTPSIPNCHVTYDASSGQVQLETTGC